MLTKSAQVNAILANPSHTAKVAVAFGDSSGSLLELPGDYNGLQVNPIDEVVITESVDDHRTAKIRMKRQIGVRSLAPGLDAHPQAATFEPFVDVGRKVAIYAAVNPGDGSTDTNSYVTVFEGYVDTVDWPEDVMEVGCSDLSARWRDTWIEWERVYGFCTGANATKGALIWNTKSDAKVLAVGDLVLPSKLNLNGHYYKVTIASSAQATTEPTWPTGSGATVVSGGVTLQEAGTTSDTGVAVETIMQQIMNDNASGTAADTLSVPTSPGWVIRPYTQGRTSVLDALQQFADQIGWCLKYSWNGTSTALRFFEPDRANTTPARTLGPDEEWACETLSREVSRIRNVIRVVYGDSTSRDGDGMKTRIARVFSNSASITKYGRRFMEVAEDDTSAIDTSTEADVMGAAILADLQEPESILGVSLPVDPYLELGDMIGIPADDLRFDSDQVLAITAKEDRYAADGCFSSLTLSGVAKSGHMRWLAKDTRVNPNGQHSLQHLDTTTAGSSVQTISPVIGGGRLRTAAQGFMVGHAQGLEVHVSETSGFTPSSATMVSSGDGQAVEVAQLVPNKTYYVKSIPYHYNGTRKVLGSPSVQTSFVAGRAKSGHYDSTSTQSHLPLNGNFEHAFDDLTSNPPDHWQVSTLPAESAETWGSSGSVYYGTDTDKGRYIELRAHASKRGRILSSPFEVRRSIQALNFYLSIMRTGASAASGKDLIVDIFGYKDAALSSLVINYSVTFSGDSAGPYPSLSTWYHPVIDFGSGYGALPTNVNFMQIAIRRGTTGDSNFAWRIGDVYAQEADFYRIASTYASLSNVSITDSSHVRAKTSSAGSYATGNTIQYGTEDYDVLSEYSTSTYKFTAAKAGKYLVSAAIFCDTQSYNSGNSVQLGLKKNSTVFAYGLRAFAPSTASWYLTSNVTSVVDLAAGDTVEVIISHDRAAGNVTLWTGDAAGNYFCVDRLH